MVEPIKRISPGEVENYIELSIYDPLVCTKAIAFTLTPAPADGGGDLSPSGLKEPDWDIVTYYGDTHSISRDAIHPLEIMYKEWSNQSSERDRGDEGDIRGND